MTSTYGNKSEHIRVRITSHELDLMSRALRHGGYESQSQFMRAAIVMLAEQTLAGPTAVEQKLLAQHTLDAVAPTLAYPAPLAEPEPVPLEVPTFDQLFRTGTALADPVEAPLDFDSEGWVG